MLLLDSVVLTLSNLLQTEGIAIKLKTSLGVIDDDRGVVDPEKQLAGLSMPLWITLTVWEPQNLESMLIGIFEVEGFDACRILVPFRQGLRGGRRVLHFILPQPCIGLVHIRDYDGDMLEPSIIAAGIDWNGAALWREVFGKLYRLVTELHSDDARTHSK